MANKLELGAVWQTDRLRRQFFQLVDPKELAVPPTETLKLPEVQAEIYATMFNEATCFFPSPGNHYKWRVLKKIFNLLEESVIDPEEDEISNDLMNYLSNLIGQVPTNLDSPCRGSLTEATKYGFVTYTVPSFSLNAPTLTLYEGRSLLVSGGDTGLRTWEAALLLGTYLYTEGRELAHRKSVLELGAGTGFLSILCAKHLGSFHVMATDGSQKCVNEINANINFNGLEGDLQGISSAVLQWGHLDEELLHPQDVKYQYDLILGADVTYDGEAIPHLVTTLRYVSERFAKTKILIAATVRNSDTLGIFFNACDREGFNIKDLGVKLPREDEQLGFFLPTSTSIKIFLIAREKTTAELSTA